MKKIMNTIVANIGLVIILITSVGCGQSLKTIEVDSQPTALAIDTRGDYLFIGCEGGQTLITWDIKKQKKLASKKIGSGTIRLYADSVRQQVVVINKLQKKYMSLSWPNLEVEQTQEFNHGPSAWYFDEEANIHYFSMPNKHMIQPLLGDHALPIIQIGLGPEDMIRQLDTNYIWAANFNANEVAVVNSASNLVVKRIHVWANPYRLAIGPADNKLYVLCIGKQAAPEKSVIQTIDLNYQTAGLTWSVGKQVHTMSMDPKGRFLFLLDQHELIILSLATGTILSRITTPSAPSALAVSPNGEKVYVACKESHLVAVYNINRKKLLEQ